jgi:hypothetical protein
MSSKYNWGGSVAIASSRRIQTIVLRGDVVWRMDLLDVQQTIFLQGGQDWVALER